MKKLKIMMTGGGTAGHVTPNLALIPRLKQLGYEIQYIGTRDGKERGIIEGKNIKYHIIESGKLRRYFDIKNFTDPFKVIKGVWQAKEIIKKEKPNIIFSKGGFVAVPVVIGAFLNKIPVIAHESDLTPGLANKISSLYCTKVCVTFEETLKHIKNGKGVLTGTPIREEFFKGNKTVGLDICKFSDEKPVLMIIGGSSGAKRINETIRKCINKLLPQYNIIHICGNGNVDNKLSNIKGYKQFEYVNDEMPHLLMAADVVISRAGANGIFELLALKKPNLLIPLPLKSSRGDQILNANYFNKLGYSMVLQEEDLNEEALISKLDELYKNRGKYVKNMSSTLVKNGVESVIEVIQKNTKKI